MTLYSFFFLNGYSPKFMKVWALPFWKARVFPSTFWRSERNQGTNMASSTHTSYLSKDRTPFFTQQVASSIERQSIMGNEYQELFCQNRCIFVETIFKSILFWRLPFHYRIEIFKIEDFLLLQAINFLLNIITLRKF